MANLEWQEPEMLRQRFVRRVNPQSSKHWQKWMLSNEVCFDIRELPLGAVCRWRMLTFWWTAPILNLQRATSLSFYGKISPKPSACPYFSLNKIAPIQLAKGQGPPMKRALIYDYVHKLKLWVIQACCHFSVRTLIMRALWNLNISRIARCVIISPTVSISKCNL